MAIVPRLAAATHGLRRGLRRLNHGPTLGVRALVFDSEGRVLLLEHTYVAGWFMPGGGVERAESAETALIRELMEEAGVEARRRPRLISVHDNSARFRGDHVAIYAVDAWVQGEATARGEIAALGFFPLDALPPATTPATRRRLDEHRLKIPPSLIW
jgi:ADP-ribose pyrophosphatase YjhB (NUDIX family)